VSGSQPAIETERLGRDYGNTRALDSLDLRIPVGAMVGLLGPNGAGKTTVIRVVTTLLKPAAGTVRVFGLDTRRSTMRVRRRIGYQVSARGLRPSGRR